MKRIIEEWEPRNKSLQNKMKGTNEISKKLDMRHTSLEDEVESIKRNCEELEARKSKELVVLTGKMKEVKMRNEELEFEGKEIRSMYEELEKKSLEVVSKIMGKEKEFDLQRKSLENIVKEKSDELIAVKAKMKEVMLKSILAENEAKEAKINFEESEERKSKKFVIYEGEIKYLKLRNKELKDEVEYGKKKCRSMEEKYVELFHVVTPKMKELEGKNILLEDGLKCSKRSCEDLELKNKLLEDAVKDIQRNCEKLELKRISLARDVKETKINCEVSKSKVVIMFEGKLKGLEVRNKELEDEVKCCKRKCEMLEMKCAELVYKRNQKMKDLELVNNSLQDELIYIKRNGEDLEKDLKRKFEEKHRELVEIKRQVMRDLELVNNSLQDELICAKRNGEELEKDLKRKLEEKHRELVEIKGQVSMLKYRNRLRDEKLESAEINLVRLDSEEKHTSVREKNTQEISDILSKEPKESVPLKINPLEFKYLKVALENEIKEYKRRTSLLEKVKCFEEETTVASNKDRTTHERNVKLSEEIMEIEKRGREMYLEIEKNGYDMECVRLRTENEFEVWKKRFVELEKKVMVSEEKTSALLRQKSQFCREIKMKENGFIQENRKTQEHGTSKLFIGLDNIVNGRHTVKGSEGVHVSDEVNVNYPSPRKRSRASKLNSNRTSYIPRPLDEVRVASSREREIAIAEATNFQSSLTSGCPSFIKSMVHSHVSGGCFWLDLPRTFCNTHLPLKAMKIILEDEIKSVCEAEYIGSRTGLGSGWRGFALNHNLDDGDALVFELTEPARFKVYIFKAVQIIGDEGSGEDSKSRKPVKSGKSNQNTRKECKKAAKLRNARKLTSVMTICLLSLLRIPGITYK